VGPSCPHAPAAAGQQGDEQRCTACPAEVPASAKGLRAPATWMPSASYQQMTTNGCSQSKVPWYQGSVAPVHLSTLPCKKPCKPNGPVPGPTPQSSHAVCAHAPVWGWPGSCVCCCLVQYVRHVCTQSRCWADDAGWLGSTSGLAPACLQLLSDRLCTCVRPFLPALLLPGCPLLLSDSSCTRLPDFAVLCA